MTLRRRLHRLEDKARPSAANPDGLDLLTDEDWLAGFEAWGRQGHFEREPDFQVALVAYRDALQRAKAQAAPPFDPPADFMPSLLDRAQLRTSNWRRQHQFPEVSSAWNWLAEMLVRVSNGKPAVTEAEFFDLAGWFRVTESRLRQEWGRDGVIDLGNGKRTSLTNVAYGLSKGPRAIGITELVEELRQLKAFVVAGSAGSKCAAVAWNSDAH
jgi:hypothetical protein